MAIAGLILGYIVTVLVTIIFIWVFAASAAASAAGFAAGFAAGNAAIQKARKTTCLATAIGIESAVLNFFTEYGSMPQEGYSDATVTTDADTATLKELLGLSTKLNTRGIKFLSVRIGEDGKNGLIYGADAGSVLGLYEEVDFFPLKR